ncbi:hypothetical protein JOC70_003352 [Clostridium pascui]|uniref:hypothetical protein n=1 Tax=Clostridium pascui TaxID=46609 RepID=UPI003C6F90EF|nr:hypothetical protein [Clostridium pascui]
MTKVKQKISGTFRSSDEANAFISIHGYISTVRKQEKNTLECIKPVLTVMPLDIILT